MLLKHVKVFDPKGAGSLYLLNERAISRSSYPKLYLSRETFSHVQQIAEPRSRPVSSNESKYDSLGSSLLRRCNYLISRQIGT
jgi:hypothetical protein